MGGTLGSFGGQGGRPNSQPARQNAQYGTNPYYADLPEFVGGQRGPVPYSRVLVPNGPAGPEPLIGWSGRIAQHRGAFVEDAAAPRLVFDSTLGHSRIAWFRPTYANAQGRLTYHAPNSQPSWTANEPVAPLAPLDPIPVANKHIGNFTVHEEYGSTRYRFNTGSLAEFKASIQQGMSVQGRRWLRQAKTSNPWQPNLSVAGPAGSYGQTTKVLPTAPANVPGSFSTYGAY